MKYNDDTYSIILALINSDTNCRNNDLYLQQLAWPLLHRGVSRQQDGFKDTMCALEDKAAKVGIISQHSYLFRASKGQGIAPYLQLSLLTDLNHTG